MLSATDTRKNNGRWNVRYSEPQRTQLGRALLGLSLAGLMLVAGCSSSDGNNNSIGGKSSSNSGGKSSNGGSAGKSETAPGGAAGMDAGEGGSSSTGAVAGTSQASSSGGGGTQPVGGAASSTVGGATALGGSGGIGTPGSGGAAAGGTTPDVGGSAGAPNIAGGAAGAGAVPGFPDLTQSECVTCLTTICNDDQNYSYGSAIRPVMPACGSVTGVAADGPGAGVAKKQLCENLFGCMNRTRCALIHDIPNPPPDPNTEFIGSAQLCYCGTVDAAACLSSNTADGLCKDEFEAAFETSTATVILFNLQSLAYAGGFVGALTQCAIYECFPKCYTR